jgi:hypothetical protein
MTNEDLEFSYTERKSGEIVIFRRGVPVMSLRETAAFRFKRSLDLRDAQLAMARATGKYRRGNEHRRKQNLR